MFYVYAYLRKSDLTPYYIGKGKKNRAWQKHAGISVPNDKTKIVILESGLTEIGAFAIERRYICWYGRKDLGTGVLLNKTDGGPGTYALVCDDEFKKALSKANTGKKLSARTKEKIGASRRGKPRSEEVKAKIAATKRAKPYVYSEEVKAKISQAHKGKKTGRTPWNKGLTWSKGAKLKEKENEFVRSI